VSDIQTQRLIANLVPEGARVLDQKKITEK
jgi:hypothetical protein